MLVDGENAQPSLLEHVLAEADPPGGVIAGDWTEKARLAIEMTTQDDGWAFLGAVGTALRKLDSAFDARSYGHKQLSLPLQVAPRPV